MINKKAHPVTGCAFCCSIYLLNFEFDRLHHLAINIEVDLVLAHRPGIAGTIETEVICVGPARNFGGIDLRIGFVALSGNQGPCAFDHGTVRSVIQVKVTIEGWGIHRINSRLLCIILITRHVGIRDIGSGRTKIARQRRQNQRTNE